MPQPRNPWKEYRITCCTQCVREIVSAWAGSGHNAFGPGKVLRKESDGAITTNLSQHDMAVLVRNSAVRHPINVREYLTGCDPDKPAPWEAVSKS